MDISINCGKSEWDSFSQAVFSILSGNLKLGQVTNQRHNLLVESIAPPWKKDHNIISESCLWSAEVKNYALSKYGVLIFVCVFLFNPTWVVLWSSVSLQKKSLIKLFRYKNVKLEFEMGDCEAVNFSDTGRLTDTGAFSKLVLTPTPQFWHSGGSNPPKNLGMGETHTYSSCYLNKCMGAHWARTVCLFFCFSPLFLFVCLVCLIDCLFVCLNGYFADIAITPS